MREMRLTAVMWKLGVRAGLLKKSGVTGRNTPLDPPSRGDNPDFLDTRIVAVRWDLGLVIALCLLAGCAQDHVRYRDGQAYGVTEGTFRTRWWSYFERGTSYMDGGFYEEAVADFEKALDGRPEDTWRARTYGLHFVPYFPNRELGICLSHLERHDEARAFLTRSLQQVDTARAHHFLDETRRAQLASGKLTDARPPALEIVPVSTAFIDGTGKSHELPPPSLRTQGPSGIERFVPSRRLDHRVGCVQRTDFWAAKTATWDYNLGRPIGSGSLDCPPLRGDQGGCSSQGALVSSHRRGLLGLSPRSWLLQGLLPSLFAALPARVAQNAPAATQVLVTASRHLPVAIRANDDLAVAEVELNGQALYLRNSGETVSARQSVPLKEGTNTLTAKARDLAGKEVETAVQVTLDLNAPVIAILDPPPMFATNAPTVVVEGGVYEDVGLAEVTFDNKSLLSLDALESGAAPPKKLTIADPAKSLEPDSLNEFLVRASDVAGNRNDYVIDVYQGASAPQSRRGDGIVRVATTKLSAALSATTAAAPVRLACAFENGQAVYADTVRLSGTAEATAGVAHVSVNGHPLAAHGARRAAWARTVSLEAGENQFVLAAIDTQGATYEETIRLVRRPGYLESEGRLRALHATAGDTELGASLHEAFTRGGRFQVLIPTDAEGSVSRRAALAAAGKQEAHLLLYAELQKRGGAAEAVLTVVDVETGQVVAVLDAALPDTGNTADIRFRLAGLAREAAALHPRPEAHTMAPGALDAGRGAGWRQGMRLAIGRRPAPHADFEPLALARITKAGENTSEFSIIEQKQDIEIGPGLLAVAL